MSGGNFGPSHGETTLVIAMAVVLGAGIPAGIGWLTGHVMGRSYESTHFLAQAPWGTTCLRHEPRQFVDRGWFGSGEIYTREVCVHAEYRR